MKTPQEINKLLSCLSEIVVTMPEDINNYDPDNTLQANVQDYIDRYFRACESALQSEFPEAYVSVEGSVVLHTNIYVNDDADEPEVIREIQAIIDKVWEDQEF